jgi:nitrate/nitrite-specific signal transduction histidine kinase
VLKEKTVKIKEGNFDVFVEPTSNDEIGDLTSAFKEMLLKLKELYANLETRVQERTQKLEESERKLKENLTTSENNNKMMIGRELEMIGLKEQIKELQNKS